MIILASGSPRRRELLGLISKDFKVITSDADETPTQTLPAEIVKELSMKKVSAVYEKVMESGECQEDEGTLFIGADTLVFFGKDRMGKPGNAENTVKMLKKLQGNTHQVYTGVSLIYVNGKDVKKTSFAEKTDVIFDAMTDKEIEDYAATGEPFDKAGAYAIQGLSAKFIKGIEGDYHNVVGLPVAALYKAIKEIGYKI